MLVGKPILLLFMLLSGRINYEDRDEDQWIWFGKGPSLPTGAPQGPSKETKRGALAAWNPSLSQKCIWSFRQRDENISTCLGAQATPLVLTSRFLFSALWLKSPWGKCRLGDVFGIFWETTASLDEAQVPKTLCNMLNLVDFLDKAASALDEAFPPNWLHEAGCMSPTTYDITPQNHQLSTTQFVKDQHGPS